MTNGKLDGGLGFVVNLIIIGGALLGATIWIQAGVNRVDDKIHLVMKSMVDLEAETRTRMATVETRMDDRWRGEHMRMWAARLQQKNPNIVIPLPDDIIRECDRYRVPD